MRLFHIDCYEILSIELHRPTYTALMPVWRSPLLVPRCIRRAKETEKHIVSCYRIFQSLAYYEF